MRYLKTSGKDVYLAGFTFKIGKVFHSGNLPYEYTLVRNFVFKSGGAKFKIQFSVPSEDAKESMNNKKRRQIGKDLGHAERLSS